jgi:hypothetical protein
VAEVDLIRARISWVYMAGAALKFEAGRTQMLAVRSDGGRSGMPPAPTSRGPAGNTGIVDPACPEMISRPAR